MRPYKLLAEPRVAQDLLKARFYYESRREGLGGEFLEEVSATYDRIQGNPLKYQILRSEIRRAGDFRSEYFLLLMRILCLAVLHTAKNPQEWKRL